MHRVGNRQLFEGKGAKRVVSMGKGEIEAKRVPMVCDAPRLTGEQFAGRNALVKRCGGDFSLWVLETKGAATVNKL